MRGDGDRPAPPAEHPRGVLPQAATPGGGTDGRSSGGAGLPWARCCADLRLASGLSIAASTRRPSAIRGRRGLGRRRLHFVGHRAPRQPLYHRGKAPPPPGGKTGPGLAAGGANRPCHSAPLVAYSQVPQFPMILLGVNIDHCATLRQARYRQADATVGGAIEPDPVALAVISEQAGADGITVHLREDRRHIQDHDVERLRAAIATRVNLEMACTAAMTDFMPLRLKPESVCLVPENRREVTTEGGLDVVGNRDRVRAVVDAMNAAGIKTSLFIGPDAPQIELAAELGAPWIELHTGAYANAYATPHRAAEFERACGRPPNAAMNSASSPSMRDTRDQLRQHRRGPHPAAFARAQHRPQHPQPRGLLGDRGSGPRDEGPDEPEPGLTWKTSNSLPAASCWASARTSSRSSASRARSSGRATVLSSASSPRRSAPIASAVRIRTRTWRPASRPRRLSPSASPPGSGRRSAGNRSPIYHGLRQEPLVRLDDKGQALLQRVGATGVLVTLSHTQSCALAVAALVRSA